MASRPSSLTALLLALAAIAAAPTAVAQVRAPKLVEEGEEPEEVERKEPAPPPVLPQLPAARPSLPTPPSQASPPARAPTAGPASSAATSPASTSTSTPTSSTPAPAPAPAAAPAPARPADLAREIVLVKTSWSALLDAWNARRAALREADPARAEAARAALLASQRELAIENLFPFAAAEAREAHRALSRNLPTEALARADTAVALAPDLPDAHLARARARFALEPGKPGPALASLRDAVAAAAREPHTLRAFWGDLFSAGLAAVFTAAAVILVLLLARRVRLFLHDFHHLPVLRGTAPIQTGFLALVLLGVPLAFGWGPLAVLGVALLAAWLYLSRGERVVATLAFAALLGLPHAAGLAARAASWTGSLAEQVHAIEFGALPDEEAAALVAAARTSPAPAPLLAALGRHLKRRGDLDGALALYRDAQAAGGHAPELLVNAGNALFLKGDLDGAKASYLAAADQAGGDLVVLGAANYNLSKLYLRSSEMDKNSAARERAERAAGDFLRDRGSDTDFSANRYLVDVPVPDEKIAALATLEGLPQAMQGWIQARLAGGLPAWVVPWGGAGFLALLWLLAVAGGRLSPAGACETCGRPACRRCDGPAVTAVCGQCQNVFQKKNVVDPRDRLRKEAQVRRHRRFDRAATRVLSVVGAGAAQVFHGAAARGALLLLPLLFAGYVLWFWRGVMPPPQPSPYVLAGKLLVAAPLGLAVWALAVRDAFRRTRSG